MFLAFLFVLVFLFRFPFLGVESPLGAVLRKNKVFGVFFVDGSEAPLFRSVIPLGRKSI